MMKYIFFILFFLLTVSAQATNYYISAQGNDRNDGLTPATALKSIDKLNNIFSKIHGGDSILFNRGNIFYGGLLIQASGTEGRPIVIDAYGRGSNPVLSGFVQLKKWSLVSNGIYAADIAGLSRYVNLVTLNNQPQPVGRYPNVNTADKGYLTYESSSGSNSITDNQLTGSPDWTGAEVVIRKNNWTLDRGIITSHTNNTLQYNCQSKYAGRNNYGYFIQRDPRTLDQLGEWYYDSTGHRLQMFFGGKDPDKYSVQISTIPILVNVGQHAYISINNLDFEGADVAAVSVRDTRSFSIRNGNIRQMGKDGIIVWNTGGVIIGEMTIYDCFKSAIDVTDRHVNNVVVKDCIIKNSGNFAGMGSFGSDNDYKAMVVVVQDNLLIECNTIDSSGLSAIQFQGSNATVQKNVVSNFCYTLDDGGGIYTYQSGTDADPGPVFHKRVIKNNIVYNGIGAKEGGGNEIDVSGIYTDGITSNVDILDNTVFNVGEAGIYCNNAVNITIRGNISYNNGTAFGLTHYSWGSIKNLEVIHNVFFPTRSNQLNFQYMNTGLNKTIKKDIKEDMQSAGNIDSNYIATPNPNGFKYIYAMEEGGKVFFPPGLSFEEYKKFAGHEKSSRKVARSLAAGDQSVRSDSRLEYNTSDKTKTITLDGTYYGLDNTVFPGKVTVPPYSSVVLIKK